MIAGTENDRLNHQSLRLHQVDSNRKEYLFTCNINNFLAGDFTNEYVDAIARRFLRGLISARQKQARNAIVFIAYGLGALVVEKAICIAGANEKRWPGIFACAARFVFDRYTASIGLPHETFIQEQPQNRDEPFWELGFMIFMCILLTRPDYIPRPSWIPMERTLLALAPVHRQLSSAHLDPLFPACQTDEVLKWHRSNDYDEVSKAAEQTLFRWVLGRGAERIDRCNLLPFSFVFSSHDPLRCSMKSMLTALWLSHFAGQKHNTDKRDYELMKDQHLLHHAWTEVDLFNIFTARYIRLMGRNTLLSRRAFWRLLNSFAAKSEAPIKIVVTGKESFDLFRELYQCIDIQVDVCEVTAGKVTVSSTGAEILDRTLRDISDQQGLRWIWNWISRTQRPLSYDELAMALCYRNYRDKIQKASCQIRSWLRGITESRSGQVHIRNSVRLCLEDNSRYIWVEMTSPNKILEFLLEYLTAPETRKRLGSMCDEYESRVQRYGERITPPLIADGHDILFYANNLVLNDLLDELRATDCKLGPWSRAYWAMSNPFSRPKFGTLRTPYETLLKLGNMGRESIAILEKADNLGNPAIMSIDTPTNPMELDSLVTAIREGDEDVALSLAKRLISLSKKDGTFHVPMSLLLDDGMDLSPATAAATAFVSPLHMANRLCHASIMEIFFRHEARLDHERSFDAKAKMLSVAAACGNIGAAKSLVGNDKSLLEERIATVTPLVAASNYGNYGMVECLLKLGADPNSGLGPTSHGSWAPLAIAASFEHPKTMKMLLKNKACPNVRGMESGTTPLFYAVKSMNVDLVRLLMRYGANPKHKHLDRPLLIEVINSEVSHKTKTEMSDVLIGSSPLMVINGQDLQGWTPLIHASRADDLPMVEWLLERGADINLRDKDGHCALFHALNMKHEKIVKRLLESKPTLNALTSAGHTLFESAMEDASYVQLLLDAGADPELPDKNGATAINTAAMKGKASVVKLLVDRKVDIHRPDQYGRSAIMYAAELGSDADTVRILIKGGADLGACAKYHGFTPLHAAARGGHPEIIKVLLEHRKMIDLEKRARNGETALLVTESEECLKLLILAGADINAQDHQGQTVLTRAAGGDRERYLETALIIACRLLKDDLVLKLLKHGADPNMTSKSLNCTALVATCMPDEGSAIRREKEKKEIIRHLLDQRADVNAMGGNTVYTSLTYPDPLGRLPIQFAAANGISNFKAIFRKQSDLTEYDCTGKHVLHWAAQFGHVETVKYIMRKLTESEAGKAKYINFADNDGWTPLCWAVRPSTTGFNVRNESEVRNYTETVKCLLDHGADRSVTFEMGVGEFSQTGGGVSGNRSCLGPQQLSGLVKLLFKRDDKDGRIKGGNDSTGKSDEYQPCYGKYVRGSECCNICLNTIFGCSFKCTSCIDFDVCRKCYGSIDQHHGHLSRKDDMPHDFIVSPSRDQDFCKEE
ncbi:ankyrin repeat-containing domain protein [Trichoderma sp. SZMC 28014]